MIGKIRIDFVPCPVNEKRGIEKSTSATTTDY